MPDKRQATLAIVATLTPCSHGVEPSAYVKRGALSICPLCRYVIDDKAWHGQARSDRLAPRDLLPPVSPERSLAIAEGQRMADKASAAERRSQRRARAAQRKATLATLSDAQREASEREHARERDAARLRREWASIRKDLAPQGTTSHADQAPSADPVFTRVDSPNERRSRDALPDALDHGVGWHGDAVRVIGRFKLSANAEDHVQARQDLARAISDHPTDAGNTGTNIRNRRNRARKALRRAGASASAARDALASDLAGWAVFTVDGIDAANRRDVRLSAAQQRSAARLNRAPAVPAIDAPAPTGAGWAGIHSTD